MSSICNFAGLEATPDFENLTDEDVAILREGISPSKFLLVMPYHDFLEIRGDTLFDHENINMMDSLDMDYYVVLDGNHRLHVFRKLYVY